VTSIDVIHRLWPECIEINQEIRGQNYLIKMGLAIVQRVNPSARLYSNGLVQEARKYVID